MHIKEIIINGGKINIFDALCFVMGISSLENLKETNLEALKYKKGPEGKEEASITIILDNTDKKNSALGFEYYDEITICRLIYKGKSKYSLNGCSSTLDKVRDLFLNVQLNLNNPYFLTMKGKLKQDLNIKLLEIFELIEEERETLSFEVKKELNKNQNKLDEISQIINNNIRPKMQQVNEDKQNSQKCKINYV